MTSVTEMAKSCDSRPIRRDLISWDKSTYEKSVQPRHLALAVPTFKNVNDLFGEIVSGHDCVAGS